MLEKTEQGSKVKPLHNKQPTSLGNSISNDSFGLGAPIADTTSASKKLDRTVIAVVVCLVLSAVAIGLYSIRATVNEGASSEGASSSSKVYLYILAPPKTLLWLLPACGVVTRLLFVFKFMISLVSR
jgi:hypothetical protein